ncbi:hypothetical protein J4E08_06100 [Sagittula sp. NFXS13]|uniref:hypothetical protein n=1 Tax=Sagittula sp. NFXS13 TaxID=2819095 RepID=UPI0032DEE9A5
MRWAVALLVLAATQASALSCLRPDAVAAYQAADADDARWGLVVGTLNFDATKLPKAPADDPNDAPPLTQLRARLDGQALGADGFATPFDRDIDLHVQCFGPWCAQPQSGQTYLVFLENTSDGQRAYADPCGTKLFANPSAADLARMQSCFAGEACVSDWPLP